MIRKDAIILGAALLAGSVASADDDQIANCMGPPPPQEPIAAVAESWPLVVENAFSADGVIDGYLSVTLLIEVSRGNAAPCLLPYWIGDLKKSADGAITGAIIPTAMHFPNFFYDIVTVDPAMVADWSYAMQRDDLRYGGFGERRRLGDISDQELINEGFSPDALPQDWQ